MNRTKDPGITFRVAEVRFTQGEARLHAASVMLQTSTGQYTSPVAQPQPADPVSMRSKCVWSDAEVRLPISCVGDRVKLVLINRRRFLRTVIGTVEFGLRDLAPPLASRASFTRTLHIPTALFPSLNVKVDIHVSLDANVDRWQRLIPRAAQNVSPPTPGSESSPSSDSISSSATSPESSTLASSTFAPSSRVPWPQPSPEPQLSPAPSIDSFRSTTDSLGKPAQTSSRKTKFSFSLDTDTLGVVFLEIVSVANLPKFRTLTGISFDMDPFVILSFGKRVYRTPHRRHTLNPTFNSKVAFDVNKGERGFPIVFSVWDQDKITLNDKVAECALPMEEIIERYSPKLDTGIGLYDLTTNKPCTLMLPLRHAAGTAEMMIKVQFYPMAAIRQQMWRGVISLYEQQRPSVSYDALRALLNSLGSTLSAEDTQLFFAENNLDYRKDEICEDDVVRRLEKIATEQSDRIILFRICPICHKKNPFNKNYGRKDSNSSLGHLALCASRHWAESSVLLDDKYISSAQASKRWYANFLSKFSFGSYQLGAHSANILVQDRITGQIFEEKMRTYIRIGIRVIYALGPVEMRRFQKLLKQYTLRSGIKYSSPASADSIEPFIKFHDLNMSEVLLPVSEFKTFNEFFYRKLKPGARPCENPQEPRTAVSMADCRVTTFTTVDEAIKLWIKGRHFTIAQLIGDTYPELAKNYTKGSIVIFRLAPQDYHRVHSPVDGVMGEARHIDGEYFSVNPMAVRSHLDVFGENARTVFPINSEDFGTVLAVMVGAMMVGSCVVEAQAGQTLKRTDDVGYFKFGGSTVILLFEPGKFVADSDLRVNSSTKIETRVRVGMSIGHTPDVPEYNRSYDTRPKTIRRAKSEILGGGSYLPFSLD